MRGGGGGQRSRLVGRVKGRGIGRGDARNRSPAPSAHHSGPGYRPPLPHRQPPRNLSPPPDRRGPGRRLSPIADRRGPRRSLSPLANRPRQSPVPRGSPSKHRRESDYALRRPDQGNRRPPSFDKEGMDFQHKYMLPEHPTDLRDVDMLKSSRTIKNDLRDVHNILKSSRTIKNEDFGGSSSGIDSQGMLAHKSLVFDDGSKRTFYTLPHDPARPFDAAALNSSGNMRSIGSGSALNVGLPAYGQRARDPYDDRGRDKLYSRDVSFPSIPPSQARPYASTPLSSFPKDMDTSRVYGDRGGAGKLVDVPLEHNGYSQLSDNTRRASMSVPPRAESPEYGYNEAGRRGEDDHVYNPSDVPFHKTMYGPRDKYRNLNGTSFAELAGRRIGRDDAYHKSFNEGSSGDQHHSIDRVAGMNFCELEGVRKDYVRSSGSEYMGFGPKASRDRELSSFEESLRFGKGIPPVAYRERTNSPMLVDHPFDGFSHRVSSPREESRMDGYFDDFDAPEELLRRNYVIADDLNRRDAHRRVGSPNYDDQMWSDEEYEYEYEYAEEDEYAEESRQLLHSKRPVSGSSQHRLPLPQRSGNDGRGLANDSSPRLGGGRGISLKKRLRPGRSDFHDSVTSQNKQEFYRPHKVWKKGQEDRNSHLNASDGDIPFDSTNHRKKDPPEDSDEFKQQVHKAFLRFSKLLNENPHQQKRFREDQERRSKLLCCVCGSLSKEFVDVHSLLTHSYNSLKVGLRTDHLGLHKALCVLNGWNWFMAPDNSMAYSRRPPSELKALKEDLIVWPPVVIIHNSSIGNKNKTSEPKVVSIGKMEEILRELGFGGGNSKVCRGKAGNQSVLIAKFMPTLSGLQEAERLHKYYAENKRGREGFQQITCSSNGNARAEKDEELLYGYMAVAEDLDKLDPETKKRSLVKSKKEIEAIADAPLK